MSAYSHCQECGRKVYSAFFCRKCEGAYCSLKCLESHAGRHATARVPFRLAAQGQELQTSGYERNGQAGH